LSGNELKGEVKVDGLEFSSTIDESLEVAFNFFFFPSLTALLLFPSFGKNLFSTPIVN